MCAGPGVRRGSRFQYLPDVVHLPFGFIDGAAGAAIFPLEEANDRITVVSDQRQAFFDRGVTGSQLNVGTLASLSVFNMNMSDAVVMLPKECRGIVIAGCVMTDVEVDHE